MENRIIRIAAKFQYKIPTLRTGLKVVRIEGVLLSYKDLEAGRPQLMWTLSSSFTWEIGAENRSVEFYYYYYYYFILLLLLLLLLSMMILIIGFTSKCDSLFYYKDAMVCYYKVRHLFYYIVWQVLLQSETEHGGRVGGGCRKAIEMC